MNNSSNSRTAPQSGTITALQVQKRNKERVSVFLDGEYAFAVELTAAAALRKGQTLTAEEVSSLKADDQRDAAYGRALRYLAFRPRSRAEVVRYLASKGHDADTVEAAAARLEAAGYVDDRAFARFWLEDRTRHRPRGPSALRYELRQKGIDGDLIDEVLAEVDPEAAAWQAIERKLPQWRTLDQAAFFQKAAGYLSRRGFSYEVIDRVVQRARSG